MSYSITKASLVILFLLLLPLTAFTISVEGYCFLQNQTSHADIRIIFEADSPSAVTDTTYTDISGYFQIDLVLGVYDVCYHHAMYQDTTIFNQLVAEPVTLPDVILEAFPMGIEISGALSGTFTDTTYIVVEDIFVYSGSRLVVEPGARFLFRDHYDFSISGTLYCAGTEEDSIYFQLHPATDIWGGMSIQGPESDLSVLKYCHISGSYSSAIYVHESDLLIENCTFTGNHTNASGGGLRLNDTEVVFRFCDIINNDAMHGGGISAGNYCHAVFESCLIQGNVAETYGSGIYCTYESYPTFINCVISNNNQQNSIDILSNSEPNFINCTIYGNGLPGAFHGVHIADESTPVFINTIIAGNGRNGIYFSGTPNPDIIHCDFHDNGNGDFGGAVPAFLGQPLLVNQNGDSCDVYFNITLDPLFVNPEEGDFNLTENSPCIDAGALTSSADPDFTIADIGAFYFDQGLPLPVLTVTVTPHSVPVTIPPGGGSFEFDVTFENTGTDLTVFNGWTEIILPDLTIRGPLNIKDNLLLQPGESISFDNLEQFIPDYAPPGDYTYQVSAGIYPEPIVDTDSFAFEKLPGQDAPAHHCNWTLHETNDNLTDDTDNPASRFSFNLPHPNPFNPETSFDFVLPVSTFITLTIYDIAGREITSLAEGFYPSGVHSLVFNAETLPSGIYFAVLRSGRYTQTEKLVLLK